MKASKSIIPNREADVRPLNQRESKMDTRKGIIQTAHNSHINERMAVIPIWHECTDEHRKAF
jgi:hypothetical protein